MSKRRVVALNFKVPEEPSRDFKRAPPLEGETETFHWRLEKDRLIVRPKGDFADPEAARAEVASWIRAWEISAGVRYRSAEEFRLVYAGAEVEESDARPGALTARFESVARISDSVTCHASRASYPPAPPRGIGHPEVEAIWARVGRYLAGEEPLTSVAYFCLTVLTTRGGIKDAASRYLIREAVLRKLSELSSTRGDAMSARKMRAQMVTLTPEDERWLRNALFAIVGHLLENSGTWLESVEND